MVRLVCARTTTRTTTSRPCSKSQLHPESKSVWTVDRRAYATVLITDLARCPILWKNVLFRRDWNKNPHVRDQRRPYATFWGRLRRQPRQPIRPVPEAVEVMR